MSGGPAPLVVTLLLDEEDQAGFDRLRAEHFPPERNWLQAHVTLFHALPGEHEEHVRRDLLAAADRAAFDVAVTGLRMLGRGVAYDLRSAELGAVHAGLAARWDPWLTRQDRQRLTPHVTVQNKVDPAVARALHARLLAGFTPWSVRARGLGLWRYLGGPWSPVVAAPFRGAG
ncbi:2'-5' RNA ligase family protein [Blastococcus sp. KM273128]|uniref:2'-5' RNA ligase family protein n=1 Tax=Blastococcus sp. KM273128 TaxID=2570314 RepID=UPI001F40CAFE|nr:2'-5' RNA ligase family protein [Blastococcus sp. KM273128]MCF6746575.1 2'-5' RNA ligase family protein [Blastococcus sp. KM273128]